MKKKMFRNVLSLVMAGLMMLGLTACGSSATKTAETTETTVPTTATTETTVPTTASSGALEKLQEKGKIVIGMSAACPPYEFHSVANGDDEIIGCDVELIKAVAEDLGVDYEIKDMDFDGLLMALQAGKIDMIISAMSPTEEREENADFSDVYYKDKHVIVINIDDKENIIANSDLQGKTIGVIKSSVQETIVNDTITEAKTKSLGKTTDLSLDLGSKKVDAILVDIPTAKLLCKANDKIMMTEIYYEDDSAGAAIAMPEGTDREIMDVVNATIARIKPEYTDWLANAMELVEEQQ